MSRGPSFVALETARAPIACYVTDGLSLAPTSDLLDAICNALDCDVDWIQVREKETPARDLLELTRYAIEAAHNASENSTRGARIFVNDRLDVALAARAAGVHLSDKSIPVAEAIRWRHESRHGSRVHPDFIIGASCHSLAEAQTAERDGASYVFFGPVFDTPSKREFGPPQGLDRLKAVCATVKIPVIAIGGINEENAGSCIHAGARGIAAIRLFQRNVYADGTDLRNFIAAIHAL